MGSAARKRNSKIFGERGRHPDIKVNDSFLLGLATKLQTKTKRLHVRNFIILLVHSDWNLKIGETFCDVSVFYFT
jgi:hypothetical protein